MALSAEEALDASARGLWTSRGLGRVIGDADNRKLVAWVGWDRDACAFPLE
jgi:hypothetical protein